MKLDLNLARNLFPGFNIPDKVETQYIASLLQTDYFLHDAFGNILKIPREREAGVCISNKDHLFPNFISI